MRIFITLLFVCLFTYNSSAQQITGTVKDAEGALLNGATVSLLKDSAVVKLNVTKNGAYNFTVPSVGNYRIRVTFVGYANAASAPFAVANNDVKVPDIQLKKTAGTLAAVAVTSQKPMVEVRADKMILNVEGTVNSVGTDALDLLRKSPGVVVDKDENLTMSGKSGVQIYIDGRPTPLSGTDLSTYLKSIQSSNIEAIELISNPSAKYEAAGNAGIINIRLKKNKSFGTNGSVNAGWNEGITPKYNAGFSLNYRNKDVNIFGNYGYNVGNNLTSFSLYRTILDSLFDQHSAFNNRNSAHNFKVGTDYFINKKNTIGFIVNGTFATPQFTSNSYTPISYVPTNTINRILVASNTSVSTRNNLNVNLNYSYINPDGRNLTINADHGTYHINSSQYQPNAYYSPSLQNVLSGDTIQLNTPSVIDINSVKIDWEQNFKKGKLGYGGKISFVNTDNDFKYYNVVRNLNQLDNDKSNRFIYKENINAGYINYNRAYKGFMIQAGVRVENTVNNGTSSGMKKVSTTYAPYDSSFKRNYTDVFPSAAITFNKNPMSQISLTYSRRIDRPAYQDINPFEFRIDAYTYMKGNINLRPQYTNSFGITHTYKYRLNTTLNYSHVNDLFVQLPDTTQKSKAFLFKRNLATQDVASINISYPFQYKKYSLFTNINSNYSHYHADLGPGKIVDADAIAANIFMQNTLQFAKTFTAELSGFYTTPNIYQGSFKAKSIWSIDAGIQKQLWKGRSTIKASVSDVFHSQKFRGTTEFAGQKAIFSGISESRLFKLNFVYRFGSNQVKAARQRTSGAEDENKRTQQSGGLIGN